MIFLLENRYSWYHFQVLLLVPPVGVVQYGFCAQPSQVKVMRIVDAISGLMTKLLTEIGNS